MSSITGNIRLCLNCGHIHCMEHQFCPTPRPAIKNLNKAQLASEDNDE